MASVGFAGAYGADALSERIRQQLMDKLAQKKELFQQGLEECWRVTSRHLLVKCQGFVHNHAPQWMPLWAIAVCGEPFEWLTVWRKGKRVSGRWTSTRSLRRNHADYLLFDRVGNYR